MQIRYFFDAQFFYTGQHQVPNGITPSASTNKPVPGDAEAGKAWRFVAGDWRLVDVAEFTQAQEIPKIPVVIDNVSGQIDGYVNNENEFTVPQSAVDVVATGQLLVPDRKFKVPFMRTDTGRVQLMPADVTNGQFTIPLKFETNGIWVINEELINSEFPTPVFSLSEYRFSVI